MEYPAQTSWWQKLFAPWTLKPRVRANESELTARSSFLQQLLSGFSYCKRLRVDVASKTIFIERRMFWFWRKRWEIPFLRVKRIDYSFRDTGGDVFRAVLEFYTVSLLLIVPEEEVPLFTFMGEYSEPATALHVLVHGSEAIYWGSEGGQAGTSRDFVKLLQQFIGAPLV